MRGFVNKILINLILFLELQKIKLSILCDDPHGRYRMTHKLCKGELVLTAHSCFHGSICRFNFLVESLFIS